jgi:hypothetical protein
MAQQTKSKSSRGSTRSRSNSRSSSTKAQTSKARSSGSRSENASKARNASRSRSSTARGGSSSSNGKSPVATAKDAVGSAAKSLKTPALAAGAGLAGIAGGVALTRDRHRKVLGVPLPSQRTARVTSKNLAEAAKSAGALAERTGQVAEQVRVVSEALSQKGSHRRSPIEVVLEGLTRRSQAAKPE